MDHTLKSEIYSQCFNLKSYDFESRKWIRGDNNQDVPINYWLYHDAIDYTPNFPIVADQIVFQILDGVLKVLAVDRNAQNSFLSYSICQNQNEEVIFSGSASKLRFLGLYYSTIES